MSIGGLGRGAGALICATACPGVGTDLWAALARAGWASRYPGSAYLFSWYGGIHPAGYSLLAPYVLAAIGTRLSMAAAAVISAVLLTLLLVRHQVPRPRAAAVWVAVALWTELSAGRAPFTLGLAAALGCVAAADTSRPGRRAVCPIRLRGALRRRLPSSLVPHSSVQATPRPFGRLLAAAALALLTCLLSPVAALSLGAVAAALAVAGRWAEAVAIAVAAGLPLGAMAVFSDGGAQPFNMQNWLPPLIAAAGVLLLVPRRWQMVRAGAIVYGLAVLPPLPVPHLTGPNVPAAGRPPPAPPLPR